MNVVLALAKENSSEVTHGRERVRVRLAEHLFPDLERLAVHSLCVGVLALAREHKSEVTYGRERRWVRLGLRGLLDLDHLLEQLLGCFIPPKVY